jgi:FxsC-like protein
MTADQSAAVEAEGRDFRSALRALYLAAGRPSARSISRQLDRAVSHTTVADLLAGRRIPSWAITRRVVTHLGGDEAEFRRLWGKSEAPGDALGTRPPTGRPLDDLTDPLAGRDIAMPTAFTTDLLRHSSGDDEPYFFLSYAHMHRPADDQTDPNLWVEKLFKDVSRHVREMAADPPARVGFMDNGMSHGAEWGRVLSEQLAVCRTFVPLYSRHYFASEHCGKEWYSFNSRFSNSPGRGGSHVRQVIPAQWIPVPTEKYPRAARQFQFQPTDLGETYAEHGFYPLTHIGRFRPDYELAVYELARKIVNVAESDPAPPGPALDYESLPNAFADSDRQVMPGDKPFHIVIAASRLADLPAGRAQEYYGTDAYGWNPYAPDLVEPLAQYARKLARLHGYRHPQEFSLLDYTDELLRDPAEPPTAPAVLLIDPWAVTQPECRRLLDAYDRMTKPWIEFVIPWNTKDRGLTENGEMLRRLLSTVLRDKFKNDDGRPAKQTSSSGIASIEEMSLVLPSMIQAAGRQFLRSAGVDRESSPSSKDADQGEP